MQFAYKLSIMNIKRENERVSVRVRW